MPSKKIEPDAEIESLKEGFKDEVSEAVTKIRAFNKVISNGTGELIYRAIMSKK